MGLARDDCKSLNERTEGQTVVCAMLVSTNPPTIKDNSGSVRVTSLPENNGADEGDVCLFLFDCSEQPPKCRRVTAIPPLLVSVAQFQLIQYREYIKRIA